MKPTPALLQIGDSPVIFLTADAVKLTERHPIGLPIARLRLEIDFDLTPEFQEWWVALAAAAQEAGGEQR